jgi:hypothetical protein
MHVLRPAHGDLCLGIRGDETRMGAEVLLEPRTDADQIFLFDTIPDCP